jgi:acyl transferase domain-containing protein
VVMGHSVGEYVAACVAGVFSLEEGLKLIAERGRLMQNLPEEGKMVVLMAEEARVQVALRPYPGEVAIAAVNGPQNVVISGRRATVQAVTAMLEREGIKTRPLNVSHAFHSPLMEPMQAEFAQVVRTITYAAPKLLLVSNVTGRLATEEVANPDYWVRHVRATVRFADGVATLHQQGAGIFVEIGFKPTLLGMAQRCLDLVISDQATEDRPVMLPSLRPGRSDWQQILESLSALYVRGVNVDWAGFDKAYTRRKVVLPTYPFQRQRCWVEASKRTPGRAALGPLIDKKVTSPVHKATLFETEFSVAALPFLADHRVYEAVVVPGACHLALVLSAAELVWGAQGYELADIAFSAALVVPEEGARTVQLVLTPAQGPYTEFQLLSFAEEDAAATLITHATGRIQAQAGASPEPVSLDVLRQRCGEALGINHIYAAAAQQQLVIGPSFRWLVGLWQGEGEVLAELRLPEAVGSLAGYLVHPGLLDACFQVTGVSATLLPFAVDALHVYPQATDREWWCHARQIGEHRWDIQLVNGLGQVVATVKGFAKQEVSSAAVQGAAVGQEWLYAVDWQPQPQFGLPPDYLPSMAQLHQHMQEGLAARLPQTTILDHYVAALARLNTLSIDYVVAALMESGLSFELGARWQSGQIAEQIGVIAPYRRLLERLLVMLAEAGILQPDREAWTVVRAPARCHPQPLPEPYQTVARAELTLLKHCGAHLGQVLRGVQEPLELLFPGGDASTVNQLYQDSPTAQIMNHLVQRAVQIAIAQLPAGRGLRLLEVGAGTGGTTVGLLPLLPARQTEYLFTDIGAAFLPKAQAKFAAYDFVAYQTLDIEQPPAGQGFALHQYDIVVAANVLHATRDLSATLTHVRQLLAPGGLLVLLEATTRHRWLDLTFGLTDGWWRFADGRTGHPLLSADQWREWLLGNGFQSVRYVPDDPAAAPLDQAVIIAQAKATYLAQERSWLLFTDATGLGAALADQLRRRGERTILVSAGAAYAHVDDHSFCIHPDHAADYAQLATAAGAVQGVVHLWSLDEALARPAEGARLGAELEVAAWWGCGTVLHLVQALLRTQAQPPGVWLVTQGAQAVQPAETVPGIAQSPLWGMGKVIALEHPELQCVCLDLDRHADAAAQAAVLCAELMARAPFAAHEDQLAWRKGLRYAARLVRHQGQAAGPVIIREDATYLITGGLGGLGLLVARWLAEQGARYLLLLGRRQPTPEAHRTLDELSARGTQVIVVQADVTDHGQVSSALAEIDPAHPLCGVIHAAGVLDDGALVQQTWERFAKVLAPKIEGAWNLHRLTQGMTLDLFVLFSSVAALLGNRGQANHAAANAFLDALAHYRQARRLPALSINWGQWAGTGRAAGLDDRYQARLVAQGLNPIAPEQGLQVLGQILGQAHAQIGVLPINWLAFREQFSTGMPLPLLSELAPKARSQEEVKQVSEQQHKLLQRLKGATASDRQELLVSYVQERITEILGLDSSFRPAPRQPLNELGVDSLMIAQLKNRFMSELEVDVPIKEFIGEVSIAQLAGLLLDHLALSSVALVASPSSDISDDMEEIVL